jgi:signal peptidase II
VTRRFKVFSIVAAVALVADQATKIWARATLPAHRPVSVIEGAWDWQLSANPGASFSLFHGQAGARVLLTVIGVIAVAAMIWMVRRARDDQRALTWGLGLVVGGALGNLLDRVRFGAVTDFVHWHWRSHDWPVFNVADVALLVGVGLMLVDTIGEGRRKRNEVEPTAGPA